MAARAASTGRTARTSGRTCSTRTARCSRWLDDRALLPPIAGVPLTGLRLRWGGELHRTPPLVADPRDAEAARPSRARRRELPRLGGAPHRRAHGRPAVQRRRRVRLPPRSRARCRPRSCGSARSARCSRRRPRRATRAAAGRRWSTRSTRASPQLGVQRRYGERVDELSGGITIVATEPADARAACSARRFDVVERPHRLRRPRASSIAAATRSSSPTSTSAAGSSASRRRTRRSPPRARS